MKRKKMSSFPTLLQAIEQVAEKSRDCKLDEQALLEMSPQTAYLADVYGISEMQALLFCVCMEKGPRRIDFGDLARHLDVSNIRILSLASDINALVRRRLLRYRDVKDEEEFDIPVAVIKALKHNEVYEIPKRTGLDCAGLFELLNDIFKDLTSDAASAKDTMTEIDEILNNNPQIGFIQKLNALHLYREDAFLLLFFCHLCVNNDDNDICFSDIDDIFDRQSDFNRVKGELRAGEHTLLKEKLLEYRCEDGIASTNHFKLTEETKRDLLAELKMNTHEERLADVLQPKDLTEKKMYYSKDIEQQVTELATFLQPEKYHQIQERMKARGFRYGFACLFYGGPGTGKTETVYQLARQTGRSIMMVDVPQIKSKWVGDSEKNIKALFDKYRELVKRSEMAPILLFNEADAIIGVRKNGAQNAVDKMENSIQNIILQEMETLDGIMIATTNLEQNLDTAFERRFLYKLKFEKPDAKVRQHIWQQMIPELSASDAETLANGYDFSGGQIENIARKLSINVILHGNEAMNLSNITFYCNSERLSNSSNTKRIGFNV